jgi:hypothetical protein
MNQNQNDPLLQYRESMKLLNNALNKACKTGAFTVDEAYLIKVSATNMEKLIELVEKKEQPSNQSNHQHTN